MAGKEKISRYGNVRRFRHEYKYRLTAYQEAILTVRADGLLQRDPYVQSDGTYLIRSLYFDDYNDTCLKENANGTDPRSKFRIRYYNADTTRILLEKKSKVRGMCRKDACVLTEQECRSFMKGQIPLIEESDSPMKKKLFEEMRLRCLIPKVIVTYERVPFIYSCGNVRITFDRKITSSMDLQHFLDGTYVQRPVLSCGASILEVKWDELLPAHIEEVLQLEHLNRTAFSKYFWCRMLGTGV